MTSHFDVNIILHLVRLKMSQIKSIFATILFCFHQKKNYLWDVQWKCME